MRMRKVGWAVDYLPQAACRIQDPETRAGTWNHPLHLEIGTGKGGYSLSMAELYPDAAFVAVEKNESAAGIAARKFDEKKLENLHLIHGDGVEAASWFAPGEVDVLHLNFSDPWPKNRNAKRRLSADAFLDIYRQILAENGQIQMKTDNAKLFEYSVLQFLKGGFVLDEISVDYRREPHPEDAVTEYEEKFIKEGKPIYRSVWIRK